MSSYFSNLPILNYNGKIAVDILTRAAIYDRINQNIENFQAYKILDGEKAPDVSYKFYADTSYDWLIYLVNQMIDPFFDWPLSSSELSNMIDARYGSQAFANLKVIQWQNNWYNDPSNLTIAQYAALNNSLQKFWKPVLTKGNVISYYAREQTDTIIATNMFVTLSYPARTAGSQLIIPPLYSVGDILIDVNNSLNYGEVSYVEPTGSFVTLKNVFGAWQTVNINTTYTVVNFQNTITTNSMNIINSKIVINSLQSSYFNSISAFEYENNLNTSKSFIVVLNEKYIQSVADYIKGLFQ